MKKWLALLVGCLALGLVAAGCGGDDNNDAGSGKAEPAKKTDTGASGGAAAGGGGAKTAKVSLKNISFNPKDVTVANGGTITWTNDESVPHDVTKDSGPGPDFSSGNGNMQQGDTFKQTFKTAGTINYVCTVHPNMTGTITVK